MKASDDSTYGRTATKGDFRDGLALQNRVARSIAEELLILLELGQSANTVRSTAKKFNRFNGGRSRSPMASTDRSILPRSRRRTRYSACAIRFVCKEDVAASGKEIIFFLNYLSSSESSLP